MITVMLKKFIGYIIAFLIIVALIIFLSKALEKKAYYKGNYYAANDSIEYYKSANGDNIAKISALQLTSNELKYSKDKEISKLRDDLDAAGIKIRNLESVVSTQLQLRDTMEIVKRDTLYVRENNDTINRICSYYDGYNSVEIEISDDYCYTKLDIETGVGVIWHKEKNKELPFFKRLFSKKVMKVSIVTTNPKIKVTIVDAIKKL